MRACVRHELARSACPPRPFAWLAVSPPRSAPRPSSRPPAALLGDQSSDVRPEGLQITAQYLQLAAEYVAVLLSHELKSPLVIGKLADRSRRCWLHTIYPRQYLEHMLCPARSHPHLLRAGVGVNLLGLGVLWLEFQFGPNVVRIATSEASSRMPMTTRG